MFRLQFNLPQHIKYNSAVKYLEYFETYFERKKNNDEQLFFN